MRLNWVRQFCSELGNCIIYQLNKYYKYDRVRYYATFTVCSFAVLMLTVLAVSHLLDDGDPGQTCSCRLKWGKYDDFCYRLPSNKSRVGNPFTCDQPTIDILHRMGIYSENFIDLSVDDIPEPVFVTGVWENITGAGMRLILNIHEMWPNQKIVVYDLGLNGSQQYFQEACNVEYRVFDYSAYPPHVHVDIFETKAWMAFVIAETLNEFGAIWFVDNGVSFLNNDLSSTYSNLTCRRNMTKPVYNSWEEEWVLDNRTYCRMSSFALHGPLFHGSVVVSHPFTTFYVPTNASLQSVETIAYDVNLIFAVRTEETIRNVVKWYLLCSLEADCIQPRVILDPVGPALTATCRFYIDLFFEHAQCIHEQISILNLLVLNSHGYKSKFAGNTDTSFYEWKNGTWYRPHEPLNITEYKTFTHYRGTDGILMSDTRDPRFRPNYGNKLFLPDPDPRLLLCPNSSTTDES